MFDFLSYSFGSVFGGCITAIIIAGSVLCIAIKQSKNGEINPIAVICCLILFCLLFFQTTWVYIAVGSKGLLQDLIYAISLQFGDQIEGLGLKDTIEDIIKENPIFSFFIHYTDLQNFDWSNPYTSLNKLVIKEINGFILRRILWSLFFIVIFGASIWYLQTRSVNGKNSKRSTRQNTKYQRRGSGENRQRRIRQRI